MNSNFKFCPQCATPLEFIAQLEDGGEKERLRCVACGYTHWNNPTPVLAAVVEYQGKILLAQNAAWPGKMFALITGFMEAGETPRGGIEREIKEETNLEATELNLIGVYDFQRMNQVIVAAKSNSHPSWWTTVCTRLTRSSAGPPAPASRWRTGCVPVATNPSL